MSKKVYNITGFDCAHCAMKTEKHLNKHPEIRIPTAATPDRMAAGSDDFIEKNVIPLCVDQ